MALEEVRADYKKYTDRKWLPEWQWKVGDQVYLSSKNFKTYQASKKLSPKFVGPFLIKEIINPMTVRLKLPKALGKVHPVFHCSLLKPHQPSNDWHKDEPTPVLIMVDGEQHFEVKQILDARKHRGQIQLLVQWKHFSKAYSEGTHHLSPLCFCSSQLLWNTLKKKPADNSSLEEHWEGMGENMIRTSNESLVTEFILIGFSEYPRARIILFCFLLVVYLISFLGNGLIIMLSVADPQLHTPMYFFICVLSTIDFILTNNALPEILVNCFIYRPTIPFSRCLTQMYLGVFLVVTECIVLAIMAYDRLAAICQPLYYTQIMSWRLCIYLVATSVALALMTTLINVLLQPTDFCGHRIINHFGCELQSLLKLACSNTVISELFMHVSSLLLLIPPFCFIVVTYGRIGLAILRISSTLGRRKAFSTCSSHLAVVSVFYGTIMIMYLRPEGKSVSEKDKVISLTYGALTPMLNPLIYSLRNKDVKGAFWKLFQRKMLM
ncbi:olfactory receptor 13H1-like [Liasis olivaceus]